MGTHSSGGPMHGLKSVPDGDTTSEGREIENLISSLNLSQLISEPKF